MSASPVSAWLACAVLVAGFGVLAAKRAGAMGPSPSPAPSPAPTLIRMSPDSGMAGAAYPLEITLGGTGFATQDNIIGFGPVKIRGVSSSDGKTVRFMAPKEVPSTGEAPPMQLPDNDYSVTVTTPVGTSNALTFKMTRG